MSSRPFTLTPLTIPPLPLPQTTHNPNSSSRHRRFRQWIQSFIPSSGICKLIAIILLIITEVITALAITTLAISNTANSPILPKCGQQNRDPEDLLTNVSADVAPGQPACYNVSRGVRSAVMIGYLVLFIVNFGLICWVWNMKVDQGNWRRRVWGTPHGTSSWVRTIRARRSVS